jgi:vacuolar protein sorting-associated protein 13A/C
MSNLVEDISCRLKDSNSNLILRAGGRRDLTHFSESEDGSHELSLKLNSCEWYLLPFFILRSKPFAVNEIGRVYVKCNKTGEAVDELIRADIILEGATFYVTFQKQVGRWPYRIENDSEENIAVWQKSNRPRTYLIRKHESIDYAWDDTSSLKKLLVVNIGGEERTIDLLQIGTRDPMFAHTLQKEPAYFGLQVLADGPVIILRVTYLGARRIKNNAPQKLRRGSLEAFKQSLSPGLEDKRKSVESVTIVIFI